MEEKKFKEFYAGYHDEITKKRVQSAYPLRRYAHEVQYQSILAHIKPGEYVLDAGCGEGTLSVLMAKKGARVVGADLSEPNIVSAKAYAQAEGVQVEFLVGDASKLLFAHQTFDVVLSSHVLEHLPDFDEGLRELFRVSKGKVVVAVPTALNGLSFVQLGGGWFYLKGLRSFAAFFIGAARVLYALVTGADGVDETYAGSGMPHVFRFPWVVRRHIRALGGHIIAQEASTLALPYFEFLLPVSRALDRLRAKPFFRELGYGTTFVIETGGIK